MERPDWLPRAPTLVRIGLAVFVLAWIFGPYALRSAVPLWLPFLIALALEVNFFVSAVRAGPPERPDRGPLQSDRDRYGYDAESDELLLVREAGAEVWIPYSGETREEVEAIVAEALEQPEEEPPEPAAEPHRRSPARGLATGLALIGGLALLFWFVEARTGWNGIDESARAEATARFSAEASRIAGKTVTIRCDESGDYVGAVQDADGVAELGGDLAYLTPERCLDLHRLASKGEVGENRTGRALAVLAHEAWHLRGVADEGVAECYAFQSGVDVGRRLGLSADHARRLLRRQLVDNTRRRGDSLEYRVPAECRDGGRLDLNPESDEFP